MSRAVLRRAGLAVGLGVCALCCLAPGLFLAAVGGVAAVASGVALPLALATVAVAATALVLRARRSHTCLDEACACEAPA